MTLSQEFKKKHPGFLPILRPCVADKNNTTDWLDETDKIITLLAPAASLSIQ